MLVELLCPKCKGALEMDDEMKIGTCPFCGTKTILTESFSNNVEIKLQDNNLQGSDQLTKYSYRVLLQGNKSAALDSVNEALRLDPDNTEAWILYSVITKTPLKPEIMNDLDMKKGIKMAIDLLSFDKTLSEQIYPIYPELKINSNTSSENHIIWSDISGGTFLNIKFEHKCNKRKNSVVHYYNWEKDGLDLELGHNTLSLKSGIHVFVNTITNNLLVIVIPDITSGSPLYFSTKGDYLYKAKGKYGFTKWTSDNDTIIVNSFLVKESSNERIDVDCEGMGPYINSLIKK